MEKGDIIEIRIDDMLDDGRGFGRKDGLAVFVNGGILGDVVHAEVTKVKKSMVEARFLSTKEPSPYRIDAECPFSGECGGCSLQELSYDAQLELKKNQVASKLARLGGIADPVIEDVIGAETLKYYRNKATFAVGPHGEVGFYKNKSHFVMDIDDCMLQTDAAMVAADALRAFLKETKVKDIKQMIVKTAFHTNEVMVVLESDKKDIPQVEKLIEMIDDAIYSTEKYYLESVSVITNNKCNTIAGKPTIQDKIGNLNFEIGPQSFYQVNPEQMVKLYQRTKDYADLTGQETVLDLYCGVGTIGIFMADQAEKVIGIESVKPAVIDANRNSVINGIINTRYYAGKAEEVLPELEIDQVNVAIVDPPRAGCDETLLETLIKLSPEKIVYVSCDPGTLARDVKYLGEHGYEFKKCTVVDQFPWTNHTEVVGLLVKRLQIVSS